MFPFFTKNILLKYKNTAVLVIFDRFWDKKVEFRFWRTDICTENNKERVLLSQPSKINEFTPAHNFFLLTDQKTTKIGL